MTGLCVEGGRGRAGAMESVVGGGGATARQRDGAAARGASVQAETAMAMGVAGWWRKLGGKMGGGEGAPLALGRLELGRLQNLDCRRLGARAARHVLVELVDGVCQLEGAELLVRVVRAGARLVAEPEPEVLHSQRLLLVNLQRGRRGGKSSEGRVAEAVQLHRPDATNREWSAARPPLSRRTPSSRLRSSPQSPVRSA